MDIHAITAEKPAVTTPEKPASFESRMAQAERGELLRLLTECHGDKEAVAYELGISRATLYRKLKKLGISEGHDSNVSN